MSRPVAFVDVETTGLDPWLHVVWEVAIIVDDVEHCWQVEVPARPMALADPEALRINRFHERYDPGAALDRWVVARRVEELLDGRHIVGANPTFDEARLSRLLHINHLPRRPWHYRLIDIEAMMLARLQASGETVEIPWKSHDLSARIGVPNDASTEHTALGDARWAKAVFERCMEPIECVQCGIVQ